MMCVCTMRDSTRHSRRQFLQTTGIAGVTALAAGCTGNSNGGASNDGSNGNGGHSGTTTSNSDGSTADSITFYNAGSLKYDPGTKKNIQRFQDETGITVNVNEVPWANLKTSLTTAWRNESNKVDAFNGPTWWLADFVSAEWVEPLGLPSDHLTKFPKNLRNLLTFDGKAYMAPQLGKWGTYLYDKKYLKEQGFDSPPGTWQEVIDMGSKLSANKQAAFAFTWGNKDVFTFKQLLYQAGGQLFDGNKPTFVDTGTKVYDQFLTPLREKNLIPDGISSMGEGGVGDTFVAGGVPVVESWTPLSNRLLESDEWGKERLGSAKPPKGPASRATFQDTNGIAVSAFSEKKGAAKQFAKFMSTTESCKTDMLVEGNPAPIPEVYDMSEIREKYPSWLLDDMKYNLQNAKSETYLAQPQVDNFLSNEITPALLGKKEPQKALQSAEEKITGLYKNLGVL